jgi:hypothetical protein
VKIHAIVCSYLGNGELDIGKTAAWLNNFVDTTFFYAMQYGQAGQKYSIDYAKTFPDALFALNPVGQTAFFQDPAAFRQAAFQAADAAWLYDANDWVVFVDASESLSVNTPFDDLALQPGSTLFKYLYDEVTAAGASTLITFGFYVFLHQDPITAAYMAADLDLAASIAAERASLQAELPTALPDRAAEINARLIVLDQMDQFNNSVLYWTCSPHYLDDPASRRLVRMGKVTALRSGTMTWDAFDNFTTGAAATAATATETAIVSYGYARYVEGEPNRGAWVQENDEGFANRLLIQQSLPNRSVGLTNNYGTPDPNGVTPTPVDFLSSLSYCFYVDQFDTGDGDPTFQQFVGLWRQNPRDGVWYVNYDLGPVPVDPTTGDPSVSTDAWSLQQPSTTGPPGTGLP